MFYLEETENPHGLAKGDVDRGSTALPPSLTVSLSLLLAPRFSAPVQLLLLRHGLGDHIETAYVSKHSHIS